jgi:hypothetical protein
MLKEMLYIRHTALLFVARVENMGTGIVFFCLIIYKTPQTVLGNKTNYWFLPM